MNIGFKSSKTSVFYASDFSTRRFLAVIAYVIFRKNVSIYSTHIEICVLHRSMLGLSGTERLSITISRFK